jgi:hypothetical protein
MKPKIVTEPCKRCNKSPRYDFNGYCMDCADELGLTAFALFKKQFERGELTSDEFLEKISNLSKYEPILAQKGHNIIQMSIVAEKKNKSKRKSKNA